MCKEGHTDNFCLGFSEWLSWQVLIIVYPSHLARKLKELKLCIAAKPNNQLGLFPPLPPLIRKDVRKELKQKEVEANLPSWNKPRSGTEANVAASGLQRVPA